MLLFSLALPIAAFFFFRSFDPYLLRAVENELNVQGSLIATQYVERLTGGSDSLEFDSRDFQPYPTRIFRVDQLADPYPTSFPKRRAEQILPFDGSAMSRWLLMSRRYNLSAVRVLDRHGCVVASSADLSSHSEAIKDCLGALEEVKAALDGKPSTVIRRRISDEATPSFFSMRRRGDRRVFVALPIFLSGHRQQIGEEAVEGVVLLSRTATSSSEWLIAHRWSLLRLTGLVGILGLFLSVIYARSFVRPLREMNSLLTMGKSTASKGLGDVSSPKELHQLGVAIDQFRQLLEERGKSIENFSRDLGHELKTPLTSIRGAAELLVEHPEMRQEQRQRFAANIFSAATRTERLVNRLLDLLRIDGGAKPRQLTSAQQLGLAEWLNTYLEENSRSQLSIVDEGLHAADVRILLEEEQWSACLGNILDNAFKYGEEGSVEIKISQTEKLLEIAVSNRGTTISEANLARLFEPFFTTRRDEGGTGLGLSIARAMAQSIGGSLHCLSSAENTCFYLCLALPKTAPLSRNS